ncbi:MAG: DUF3160 domain-containing protein [Candidatus Hermodarchaeota archaeon]
MKLNDGIKKYRSLLVISGGVVTILVIIISLSFFNPFTPPFNFPEWDDSIFQEGAASVKITDPVKASFGTYIPQSLSFDPSISPVSIQPGLQNVNLQHLTIPDNIRPQLEEYGFALVDEGYEDIYEIYDFQKPNFITTDLCLHAYHVLYDISLRILEGTYFSSDFTTMLETMRTHQQTLNTTVTESVVHNALSKNIAYLSVMLHLLNSSSYPIPHEVDNLVSAELVNIIAGDRAVSAIFGYEEDFSQYKVRGHYTRNEILSNYFKAMMYAGRMGFLLQSPFGEVEMGIEHTRMALLLLSSFNTSSGSETVWDLWDRIYQPTAFYVGTSDDLTPLEYYEIWQQFALPQGDQLVDETMILQIIDEAKNYRKPQINSMFVYDVFEAETVTQGFRLMGQRFIPDSYIFQQLVHDKVLDRMFPNGLDVFSVFGSPRAAYHLQTENQTYSDYNSQILELRKEFANLTVYDWTQNLYWLWFYSLFPLLKPPSEGYPGFMLSEAWLDKALMTTMGSWAELRHDTILYAKQPYTYFTSMPELMKGYVEPYPEVYSRLKSLVNLMKEGLTARGLIIEGFSQKLDQMVEVFERLVTISIKELENEPLTESDISFISYAGKNIASIASYNDPAAQDWVNEADDRMAIIADVHTDPNSGQVLEVATGNPFVIYVVVQDHTGALYLTRGGTFSYYEFKQPMTNRLSDEQWHTILDTDPPEFPEWLTGTLPINKSNNTLMIMVAGTEEL